MLANIFKEVLELPEQERNRLFCQLVVKEQLGILTPTEIVQLTTIQAERHSNGEIEAVLQTWDANPEYHFPAHQRSNL